MAARAAATSKRARDPLALLILTSRAVLPQVVRGTGKQQHITLFSNQRYFFSNRFSLTSVSTSNLFHKVETCRTSCGELDVKSVDTACARTAASQKQHFSAAFFTNVHDAILYQHVPHAALKRLFCRVAALIHSFTTAGTDAATSHTLQTQCFCCCSSVKYKFFEFTSHGQRSSRCELDYGRSRSSISSSTRSSTSNVNCTSSSSCARKCTVDNKSSHYFLEHTFSERMTAYGSTWRPTRPPASRKNLGDLRSNFSSFLSYPPVFSRTRSVPPTSQYLPHFAATVEASHAVSVSPSNTAIHKRWCCSSKECGSSSSTKLSSALALCEPHFECSHKSSSYLHASAPRSTNRVINGKSDYTNAVFNNRVSANWAFAVNQEKQVHLLKESSFQSSARSLPFIILKALPGKDATVGCVGAFAAAAMQPRTRSFFTFSSLNRWWAHAAEVAESSESGGTSCTSSRSNSSNDVNGISDTSTAATAHHTAVSMETPTRMSTMSDNAIQIREGSHTPSQEEFQKTIFAEKGAAWDFFANATDFSPDEESYASVLLRRIKAEVAESVSDSNLVNCITDFLVYFRTATELPWAVALPLLGGLLRLTTLPFAISSERDIRLRSIYGSEMIELQKAADAAKAYGLGSPEFKRAQTRLKAFLKKHGLSLVPLSIFQILLVGLIVSLSTPALRNISARVEEFPSFAVEHPAWVQSLALPDPTPLTAILGTYGMLSLMTAGWLVADKIAKCQPKTRASESSFFLRVIPALMASGFTLYAGSFFPAGAMFMLLPAAGVQAVFSRLFRFQFVEQILNFVPESVKPLHVTYIEVLKRRAPDVLQDWERAVKTKGLMPREIGGKLCIVWREKAGSSNRMTTGNRFESQTGVKGVKL